MAKDDKRVAVSSLPEKVRMALATPAGFARFKLGIPLTVKQEAIVNAFGPTRSHVSFVCCNEAGKTTKIMPAVILWHLTVFPRRGENGGVTATSGSWAQIKNQLMPALRSYSHKFPASWEFQDTEIKIGGVPNFMAYSASQAGRAEGFHGSPETPLMMLFDECKSVADGIIRAGEDRCRPQRMGLLSSPGFAMGKFYESQSTEAKFWNTFQMTVEDCPWIDREEMKRVITRAGGGDYDRGLQDPFIQSAFFAKFMPFVQDSLIGLTEIADCVNEPPGQKGTDRHVRLDFAAGGDENSIGVRRGNKTWFEDVWRDKNTMSAVGRFITKLEGLRRSIGLRPEEVEGDADGMGKPMVQRIQEAGWPILEYHANARAFEPDKFRNRESENWFNGTEAIKQRRVIIPDDTDFKGQLVDRIGKYDSSGLRWVESKRDLFARQARDQRPQRSPDRAEVILGAMGNLPVMHSINIGGEERAVNPYSTFGPYIGEDQGAEPTVSEDVLRGFDAG